MSGSDVIIKVDTETLKTQAELVRENVQDITKRWDNIRSTIKKTKRYWLGDASDAHRTVLDLVDGDVGRILGLLRAHPADLLRMAGIYEEAEDKAAEQAEQLPDDLF